ncbi:hypothetical protein C4559_05275 [Candidatus Microgenomates bacterium]|nr:MAG: hypothetical protein C4559_05275 [Candidatus Microgenomates bacterium]
MTITYKGKPVNFKPGEWRRQIDLGEQTVFINNKIGNGYKPKASLYPGIENSKGDTVAFQFKVYYGSFGTFPFSGEDINKNKLCRKFEIGWYK